MNRLSKSIPRFRIIKLDESKPIDVLIGNCSRMHCRKRRDKFADEGSRERFASFFISVQQEEEEETADHEDGTALCLERVVTDLQVPFAEDSDGFEHAHLIIQKTIELVPYLLRWCQSVFKKASPRRAWARGEVIIRV
ncbi:PREDICTED: uncharacterized protein LOC104761699 [Camelina sativa]|uniref:Uncharacterized protein LOC104761699 n=1 Tax=Camelina sativa TaxID=90675 RepID=A0ABM1R8W9_CAMSA|nr:PREDICTED: uncharacterized protein LOC104761699 [Camelina sativa]